MRLRILLLSFFVVESRGFGPSSAERGRLLVTFDLDDTLFPCGPVVLEANGKLCRALDVEDIDSNVMQAKIKEVRDAFRPTKLSYSELRKKAIASFVETSDVDIYFDVWLEARHEAAERLLFDGAATALAQIKQSALVGAVTNGRGNPFEMPSLAASFDFCLSGEDEDIFPYQKPHPHIYQTALARAASFLSPEEYLNVWIHVGDCLINDVQAAKHLGAKTIWFNDPYHYGDAAFTTKSLEEQAERNQAHSYIQKNCVDLSISNMNELPAAIHALLHKSKVE